MSTNNTPCNPLPSNHSPAKRCLGALLLALATQAMLSGCVNESGARLGFFYSTLPIIAILSDDLFVGEAERYNIDRTGSITVQSALDESIKCVGSFRYMGSNAGIANIRCNDGGEGELAFNALDPLSGYGYGRTSRGPASFAYGLPADQAAQYLVLPKGKRLEPKTDGLRLIDTHRAPAT